MLSAQQCFLNSHAEVFLGFEVRPAEGSRGADALSPREMDRKAVTYHRWCGKPLIKMERTPFCIPSYLSKELGKQAMRNAEYVCQEETRMINTAKPEVVHFKWNDLPAFRIGNDTLAHKDSFRYIVMIFYRTLNMAELAENASCAMLTSAYRICRFVCEHTLSLMHAARLGKRSLKKDVFSFFLVGTHWQIGRMLQAARNSLWLAKTYVVPAGMYASQVWGTGTLGVKHTTTNWAVLKKCGHHPLQCYWFRAAVKLCDQEVLAIKLKMKGVLFLNCTDEQCQAEKVTQPEQCLDIP
eukprot:1148462-Pelagomonas_calceolata.AAC.1